jgi:hypothetical protein
VVIGSAAILIAENRTTHTADDRACGGAFPHIAGERTDAHTRQGAKGCA